MGFRRSPSRAKTIKPKKPVYVAVNRPSVTPGSVKGGVGKTIRVSGAITKSKRPQMRPATTAPVLVAAKDVPTTPVSPTLSADITAALKEAVATPAAAPAPTDAPAKVAETQTAQVTLASAAVSMRPTLRPKRVAAATPAKKPKVQKVVTRVSTSGGRHWGINVGQYPNRYVAEKTLLKTALAEMETLDGTLRKVIRRSKGFDANFLGMTREQANLACSRLQARNVGCELIGPG